MVPTSSPVEDVKAVKARAPAVDAAMDAAGFAGAVIAACLEQVLPNASAVALGSEDAGCIHQLRVGLRRLRTAVSELAELNAGIDPGWEAPLADAFRALGATRDRELLTKTIGAKLLAAGAPALPALGFGVMPALAQVVQAAAFQQTLLAVQTFAAGASPAAGPAFEGTPMDALHERLDHLHRGVARSARRFAEMAAADQHRVRKRLKRLRYLAEFVGPLFRGAKVAGYLDALKPAQDALGRHNDEIVAQQACRGAAVLGEGEWFAIGWLSARQAESAAAAARALKKAGKASRFWHGRLTTPG